MGSVPCTKNEISVTVKQCICHAQLQRTVVTASKEKKPDMQSLKQKMAEAKGKLTPEMRLKGNRQLNKEKKLSVKKLKKQRKKTGE